MQLILRTLASTAVIAAGLRTKRDDPCECLNWAQVYQRNGAKCGDGHEFSFALRTGIIPWLAKLMYNVEVCYNFFQRLDDNACTNMVFGNEPGEWWNEQWCYVAKECPISTPLNSSDILAAKICDPKKGDVLLRDKKPKELVQIAKDNSLNIGMLMKFAYPIEQQANWPSVEALYRNDSTLALARVNESALVNASVLGRLNYLRSTGQGYVLDSNKGRAPFGVIIGGATYLIEKDNVNRLEQMPWTHTNFKCISNCDQ